MKQTQMEWVIKELSKNDCVSRNKALSKYITRLGAYICEINKVMYKNCFTKIIGAYEIKTVKGRKVKDYVYRVV